MLLTGMLLKGKCASRALLPLALLFASGPAEAQLNGFLPAAGRATVAISHTFESYENYWMGSTKVTDPSLGHIKTGSVALWIAMGLCERVALVANMAYVDAASDGLAPLAAQGLQDGTLLLRYRFLSLGQERLRHAFVAGAGYRAPLALYEPNRIVAIGDQTNDALFRLTYQIETDLLDGAYLATELGYDLRNEDAPDGTSLSGEIGVTMGRISPSVVVCRTWADGGFDLGEPGFSFQGVGGESLRISGKAYARISPAFGFALSGFVTPDGRNVGEASGVSTAFVMEI
jgi:hypothetical protein